MATTTWNPTPPPAPHAGPASPTERRRRHVVATIAMVIAFIVAGTALLANVGSVSWGNEAAAGGEPPVGPTLAGDDADEQRSDADPIAATSEDVTRDDSAAVGDAGTDDGPDEGPGTGGATSADDETTNDGGADDDDRSDQGTGEDAAVAGGSATAGTGAGDTDEDGAAPHDDAAGDGTEDVEPLLDVTQVQEALRSARFLVGPADGRAGQQTTAAVMAFQRVNGLAVDGVVGPATSAALLAGSAEPALVGGPADRVEVDLDAQLLHLVEGGNRVVTLHVSSGSGGTYETASGGSARAVTPVGDFVVQRRIRGVREAPLGTLYDPLYFHGGFAIHGSPSVPAHPASHGCIRVSRADASWLLERIPDGMPVQLRGGTHVFTP